LYIFKIGTIRFIVTFRGCEYHLLCNIETSKRINIRCFAECCDVLYKYKTTQEKMEERSLQLILRNITGDETFTW